ncbi:class II fructose-bisphosphate aldolase [Nitrospirillum viridazoti]|uniref:Fructose-1,6-bisphosphate aldolase n=1 Tax=Nitrospirillum viridazoti CBAmc TaxID=1441467 RepID=A0A248JV41_9PROT|nr:class II fructose-bisphosphate aldolase [Nitrospirillum amazonense]ASG22084.1 fructose-bisphosphate aldolase class II [Nitrospirillum amazonense CBAmc]TWB32785.1 fructose-bisphosphate aldolase [Nitrospirillum amazonense]
MARITLRQLLDHAAERDYGVPAFNINNMEQGLAVMEAAAQVDAPVILQASRGARSYAGDLMLAHMIDALEALYPTIPLCLHQDHGNSEATCLTALQHGFTSVMMDGSLMADAKTPAPYAYNVDITRRVAEAAHWVGASVEGELGVLGSLETGQGEAEDGHGAEGVLSLDQLCTDPDQALDFVAATRVDALAIAMGTSHGAYKFSRQPDGDILAMDVVEAIHERLSNTHLVMHGSSSVPQELQDLFNAYGGRMPRTWGVPVDEIVRGIRFGVRKINIDTDCRLAMAVQFRKTATENPAEFDPRKFLKPAMDAMKALCRDRFEQFGAAGNASRITPLPMAAMAKRYATGALDPHLGSTPVAAE